MSRDVTCSVALRLGRVSNLPTVWTNVTAATVLAGAPVATIGTLAVALACSLFYVGGMFLNDAYDREFDARVRPERPIPSGAIGASVVFGTGFGFLGAGVALIVVVARHSRDGAIGGALTATLALVGTIVLYDAWHKNNPCGPLLMGLCRVLVYVTTATVLSGAVPMAVVGGAVVLLGYLMGLTYLARQEHLDDVSKLWPLVLLATPFAWEMPLLFGGGVPTLLYLGFLGWVVFSVSHLGWQRRLDVPRAVASLIAGVSLLDGLLIAGQGDLSLIPLVLLGFASTVTLQRWIPGT